MAALIAQRHSQVYLSVSATTRSPRADEVDGVNYFFVDPGEFEAMVQRGEMLEWAIYSGQRYGTPRLTVEDALNQGRPALLEIDLAGARQVRQAMPSALQVFLVPPSFAELERRLVERGTETPEAVTARLAVGRVELAAQGEFDAVVVNDQVELAAAQVAQIMGLE